MTSYPVLFPNTTDKKHRLVIPQSRLVADVMKIFVKTGPGYDHCRDTKLIEVEMISPGKCHHTREHGANTDAI
jgi:hypothetical protein